ncbi:unnamed protein product [Paramecium sonneborni]|uniref:WD40-repeat-containing domain n=1 Tax=Paramecium sonneborni TaxID=65129 RepID=A0A8S1R0R6_9CILI|nr:unnamed protein product [Paramecium sonneborni]
MIQSKMIENEEDLVCQYKHKHPIQMVSCDPSLKKNQRLLCSECMKTIDQQTKLISFQKVFQNIMDNQKLKQESIENAILINTKYLNQLQKEFDQLKSNVVRQLDQIIGNLKEWIKHIENIGYQNINYSFFDELEKLANEKQLGEFNQQSFIVQITQTNQSWKKKIMKKLDQFKQFEESVKCEEILNVLDNVNQMDLKQNNRNEKLMEDNQIELKLIEDSNKQAGYSFQIVFDKTGSIMISSNYEQIKIWNFVEGRLKLQNTYTIHQDNVLCFVYSKQNNNFISGSRDNTIICWQQINQNEWQYSEPFHQHNDEVRCLILNKEENQLISGSHDRSIKVWQVDFIKNELNFLYSLNKHTNHVESLSLNQSETMLASCGVSHFIIWKKNSQGVLEFKNKQDVSPGYKIHFINDHQFIWVTKSKDIDDIFVFENQNGVFQQNTNKTLKLIQNNQCNDESYFPIIHNQERNLILVRHKYDIYLIRQLKDATFKIYTTIKFQNERVYGTMTNNGQYLIIWENKGEKYISFEILKQ